MKSAVLFTILMLAASISAIPNYKQCLDCLFANRTDSYFCRQNDRCLPLRSTQCPSNQIIYHAHQCVEGFTACVNMTFTPYSVGSVLQYGFGLLPGHGCFIQMDRLENGTIGTMQVFYDDPSVKVFDNDERNYTSGQVLRMPVIATGWSPRRVFVTNTGNQPIGFTAVFQGSVFSFGLVSGLVLGVLGLTLSL